MKPAYRLNLYLNPAKIERVDVTDVTGVSWREAKKLLREWYKVEIQKLRKLTEKGYFQRD